jgi:membrane protein
VLTYFKRLITRFRQENFGQLAGSLSFTTLLSLVPFVAVVISIASLFPVFGTVVGYVDNFLIENLMPGATGSTVAKYAAGFSQKARKLSWIGFGMLILTSMMLMFSIEKAFNHLWRVSKPRPLHQRLGLYLVIVLAGPIVAGAAIGSMTYAVTTSLGYFNEPRWVKDFLLKGLAVVIMCSFFAFLYFAVPNAKVKPMQALLGGVLVTAGITGVQRLFELYVIKFPTYTVLYGAFAALPVFLIWIYLCWVIVLVAALVVANFGPATPAKR